MESSSVGTCPSCSKTYPIFREEARWCHHCNWNLTIDDPRNEQAFTKLRRNLGKQLSEQLFRNLKEKQILRPRLTFEKILAYAFATAVIASSFLVLLAVPVLFLTIHWFWAIFLSIPLLMLFWTIIPKPRKLPTNIVSRSDFPSLYKLADDIADAMKTQRPAVLAISNDFNAYYTEYGFGKRKRKLISLGLPLLCQLSDEEIIAVMSHETSHGANGDVARGTYVGLALRILANFYYALSPTSISEGDAGITGGGIIATWIANITSWVVSHVPLVAYDLQIKLLFRQQQEAEYLADTLATEVCGTSAMVSALTKLKHSGCFSLAVQQAAFSTDKNIDVFDVANQLNARERSSHEIERVRRLELLIGLSLDATHPPTSYRIEYISKVSRLPRVHLSLVESQLLHAELASLRPQMSRDLIEDYLNGT